MKSGMMMGTRALPILMGLLMLTGAAQAANLDDMAGTWGGSLTARSGGQAPILVHVMMDGTGSVDSPAQGAYNVPATEFELEHNMFSFTVPRIDAHFHGMLDGDIMAVDGQWEQNGHSLPLRLIRREATPQP